MYISGIKLLCGSKYTWGCIIVWLLIHMRLCFCMAVDAHEAALVCGSRYT